MKTSIHIFDLDGTLIDSSHRYRTIIGTDGKPRIDLDFWLSNVHRCMDDTLLPLADHAMHLMDDPSAVVIAATARQMTPLDYRSLSSLFGDRFAFDTIVSRRINDNRTKGADMKIAGIRAVLDEMGLSHIQDRTFYEDNLDYLHKVCEAIGAKPIYIQSKQGY